MKRNKGITLIALILTIVIMLILLTVGTECLNNDNLIARTENIANGAKSKIEQQQTKVDELMGEFEKYQGGSSNEEDSIAHDWKYTDDTKVAIKCVCDNCKKVANSTEGRTLNIGQQIMYEATGTGSTSITAAMSGGSDQTLAADSNTKWVVLGVENGDKDANGTNETLLITAENPTTNTIYFGGAAAYNNAVDEINRMCKELYGENARGITIEDVSNCLGYTPTGGRYYYNGAYSTTENLTTKLKNLPEDVWNSITTWTTPDGQNTKDALGEYELNEYSYSLSSDGTYLIDPASSSYITVTSTAKNLVFGASKNYCYWLASHAVYVYTNFVDFGPGTVYNGDADAIWPFFSSSGGNKGGLALPIRAVVSLTSEIPNAG